MTMHGIDISSWQAGIDLSAVPADFVIVKATEGAGYVSPELSRQASAARAYNRRRGFYHYANAPWDPAAQAAFFLETIRPHWRPGDVVALDWEDASLDLADYAGVERWLSIVAAELGVTPLLYIGGSVEAQPWPKSIVSRFPLWLAWYPTAAPTLGYTVPSAPRLDTWTQFALWQYSGTGRLSGYSGDLDLNIFPGTPADWDTLGGLTTPSSKETPMKSYSPAAKARVQQAIAFMRGKFLDPDGMYKYQCVDVADFYGEWMTGKPWQEVVGGVNGAKDLPNVAPAEYWEWQANVPGDESVIPEPGDVIIYGATPGNPWGHVAVVTWANAARHGALEQNTYGTADTPASDATHGYNGETGVGQVLGWLRLRESKIAGLTQAQSIQATSSTPVKAVQRTVGNAPVTRRKGPGTAFPVAGGPLKAGEVGNFVGYSMGEKVGSSRVWFKGISGDYFWAGAFTDSSVKGLPNLTPQTKNRFFIMKDIKAGVIARATPSTKSPVLSTFLPSPKGAGKNGATVTGWARGEAVGGNQIWYRLKALKNGRVQWMHSSTFTDEFYEGLPEVKA